MSDSDRRIADTEGRVAMVPLSGGSLTDVTWADARIVLTDERLLLVGEDGKRGIDLAKIQDIGDPFDADGRVGRTTGYVGAIVGEQSILLAPPEPTAFEFDLYAGLLDGTFLHVRHPVVNGGVVTGVPWEEARLTVPGRGLKVITESGDAISIPIRTVGSVADRIGRVEDEERTIVEVEHGTDGNSVVTALAGPARICRIVSSLLEIGATRNRPTVDLDARERQIVLALHSGISPFEMPAFTEEDVDEIEHIYDRLVKQGILSEVRKRREVEVTPVGRNIAAETARALEEQELATEGTELEPHEATPDNPN